MRVLLIHPDRARDYSVPVPPLGNSEVIHVTVEDLKTGMDCLAGHRFDLIVLPNWSRLLPDVIDLLNTRLGRDGFMVVL